MNFTESEMNMVSDKELQQTRVFRTMVRLCDHFIEHAKREAQQVSHTFRSINGEQWRMGMKRHNCADCGLDYSDPIHGRTA